MKNFKHLETIKAINEQIDSLDKEICSLLAMPVGRGTLVQVRKELINEGNKLKANLEELAKKFASLQEEYDEQQARQVSTDGSATEQESEETLQKQLSQEMENIQQLQAKIHEHNEQINELMEKQGQKKIENSSQSQLSAEEMYEIGKENYKKENYSEAVKWYRKAAEQGYAIAQTDLADMYVIGKGVSQDDSEAVKWYRKAAEQGYAIAQFNLAKRYHFGEGVPKDASEAVKWLRKAAEQGNASAQNNLLDVSKWKRRSTRLCRSGKMVSESRRTRRCSGTI